MRNLYLAAILLTACAGAVGCCGPMGCGPGCGLANSGCNDCEGGFGPRQPLASGPIDALRNMRRSMVCGGGCGEVYYGEWLSTPPDCADPCCGTQFVGGATKCSPFCWQPGLLIGNLYGKRVDDCGCATCGETGCDDCGETMAYEGSAVGSGCTNCASAQGATLNRMAAASTSKVAQNEPPQPTADAMTRQGTPQRIAPRTARAPMTTQGYR